MKRHKDQAGTCPCIVKGCDLVSRVFRFKAQAADPSRQRMAGKFYMQCDVHGIAGQRGEAAVQEFIMDNGDIWGPNHQREETEKPPPAPEQHAKPTGNTSQPSSKAPPQNLTQPPARKVAALDQWLTGGK